MNSKTTKRALLSSAIALLICFTMMLSTTFAWFTDTAVSASNVIIAGNLDIVVEYTLDGENWKNLDGADDLFQKGLWEPGHTEVVALRIKNNGTLALKYNANMNIVSETIGKTADNADIKLSDILTVSTVTHEVNQIGDILLGMVFNGASNTDTGSAKAFKDSAVLGQDQELLPGAAHYVIVTVDMAETVGNEANYRGTDAPSIEFGVNVLATQFTYENDSFGNKYDKDALYPVANATELAAALADGKDVILGEDIILSDAPIVVAANADQVIDLNGNTLSGISTSSTASNLIKVPASSSLTLANGTVSFGATTPDTNWGGVGQPAFPGYANNTINCSGTLIIDGATIENVTAPGGASYAIDCYPGANLIINDGVIDGHGKVAIRMFANSATVATNVTINGGTITGRRGIWVQLPSSNSAVAPIVNLTVNGGVITATDSADCAIYSYSYGNSFANTNVTITGGTFNGVVGFGGGYKGDQETVTVTGGTFNDSIGRYLANDGWEDITIQ